jgi:alcohol dehydrogenase class IV
MNPVTLLEVPRLAAAGLNVTRLMKNNPRQMTQQDAESIFHVAFHGLDARSVASSMA